MLSFHLWEELKGFYQLILLPPGEVTLKYLKCNFCSHLTPNLVGHITSPHGFFLEGNRETEVELGKGSFT